MEDRPNARLSVENIPEIDSPRDVEAFELHAYVRVSTLRHDRDKYYGKFSATLTGACDEQFESYIYRTAIAGFDVVGTCPGDDQVVRLDYD